MKSKKICAVILSVIVLLVFLSACGGNTQNPDTSIFKGPESDLAYKISDKPLELTMFYAGVNGTPPFKDSYPVFVEAARLTNIKLKGTVTQTTTDAAQAFNIMMASTKIDDIVTATKGDFDKYAGKTAFLPLDDLIDMYAPNIKNFLDENPEVKKGITSNDGKIYFIPRIEDGVTAKGWYIRKDWLDKLGLEAPKTLDDFYNVMKAFKEKDPNGNGIADEVPFFDREPNLAALYNLFGIRKDFYINEQTGKIEHAKYIAQYKKAAKELSRWYAEGLIDKEIFTRGANSREILLGDNLGGITHDWFTSTSSYNEKLQGTIDGFNFIAIPPPADINGDVWEDTTRAGKYNVGWGISGSNKHIAETMKYFDFWFTEQGRRLFNYGIEGVQYDMVSSQPVFKDNFLKSDKSMTVTMYNVGINIHVGIWQDFGAERQFMTKAALEGMDLYTSNNYIKKPLPDLPFSESERKILTDKLTAVESFIKETEQKWIFGNENVDSTFDAYMQNCKNLGMDDVLKAYNDAYQRYLAY